MIFIYICGIIHVWHIQLQLGIGMEILKNTSIDVMAHMHFQNILNFLLTVTTIGNAILF